jgi:hypothetical protein
MLVFVVTMHRVSYAGRNLLCKYCFDFVVRGQLNKYRRSKHTDLFLWSNKSSAHERPTITNVNLSLAVSFLEHFAYYQRVCGPQFQ